jgi:hypothetical protein
MSSVKHNRLILTDIPVVTSDISISISSITEKQKIQASDKQTGDRFAQSVSINGLGDMVIIGAYREDTGALNAGAAYIFTKNSSDIWSEKQKIQASDRAATDLFGISVDINDIGDTIIVGANGKNSLTGAAYIFTKNSSDIWNEKQKILASDGNADDYFGYSVSMNSEGNVVIVGAPLQDTGFNDAGAAYIFTKNSSDIWSEKQKLQASDRGFLDAFGTSVSLNAIGDIAAIGAKNNAGEDDAGAAYIFTKNSSDIWSQKQKIQASDLTANALLGFSVVINASGDMIVVGAPIADTGSTDTGAVYIFTKNSSDIWSEKQKIQASDRQSYDRFGLSVSINSVSSIILVGSPGEDTLASDTGSAYIFTKDSSDIWSQKQKIQASDPQVGSAFGNLTGVKLNNTGGTMIIGARLKDTGGTSAGAAYIFTGITSDTPLGGALYSSVDQYDLFRMKSDNVINYKT